jgi:hypothetical protein
MTNALLSQYTKQSKTIQNKEESNLLPPFVTYVQTKGPEMAPYVIARMAYGGSSFSPIMESHSVSMKLNINWNSPAATPQRNLARISLTL